MKRIAPLVVATALAGCSASIPAPVPVEPAVAVAVEQPITVAAPVVAAEPPSSTSPDQSVTVLGPETVSPEDRRREQSKINWKFVGLHYATGVGASLVILPSTYALVGGIGSLGNGLGPVIAALLVGAFVPPIATYSLQYAVGRTVAKRRDRFYPGFLTNLVGHLGIYAGSILAGADFQNLGHLSAIVVSDAVGVTALGTAMAELTANRAPLEPSKAEQDVLRFSRLTGTKRQVVFVPVVQLGF